MTCPTCGAALQLETNVLTEEPYHPGYHVAGTPLPTRTRRLPAVAFCSGCEFVHVVSAAALKP